MSFNRKKHESFAALLDNPVTDYQRENIQFHYKDLINEHFDNPPLKFEELKPNMLVYDKKFKFFFAIFEIHEEDKSIEIVIVDKQIPYFKVITLGTFEENRFYRKQVE